MPPSYQPRPGFGAEVKSRHWVRTEPSPARHADICSSRRTLTCRQTLFVRPKYPARASPETDAAAGGALETGVVTNTRTGRRLGYRAARAVKALPAAGVDARLPK